MKTKKLFSVLTAIIFLITILFTLTTCKKDKSDDQNNNVVADITTNKTNVSAFEMAELNLKSGTFQLDRYVVQIGGKDLDLIKLNDTTLLFLAPKLLAGNYKITGAIDNKIISIDLIFNQSVPPQNPKEYSAGVLNQMYQNIDTLVNQMSQDTLNIQTNLGEVAQYYHSKFLADLNNLSTEETENLSLFIQSNYSFLFPPKQTQKPVHEIIEETFNKMKKALNDDLFSLQYNDRMIRLAWENPLTYILIPVYILKYLWYWGW